MVVINSGKWSTLLLANNHPTCTCMENGRENSNVQWWIWKFQMKRGACKLMEQAFGDWMSFLTSTSTVREETLESGNLFSRI